MPIVFWRMYAPTVMWRRTTESMCITSIKRDDIARHTGERTKKEASIRAYIIKKWSMDVARLSWLENRASHHPALARRRKKFVPDAFFTKDNVPHFVEIDRLQHMKMNEKKIQYYAYLTNIYQKQQQIKPIIICCTISDCREQQLMYYALKHNVYVQMYLLQDVI